MSMKRHGRARQSRHLAAVEPLEARALLSAAPGPLQVLIGEGAAKSVTFTDANGTQATVFVDGPGAANVIFDGTSLSEAPSLRGVTVSGVGVSMATISATGTTTATTLRVQTRGHGRTVTCGPITSSGSLAGLIAPGTIVSGNITAGGWVRQIQLAGAHDGLISVGAGHFGGGALALAVGDATNESLNSLVPISSIAANSWTQTNSSPQVIQSSRIGNFTVKGNFAPNITLVGAPSVVPALAHFRAATITGGTWAIGGNAGDLEIGAINSWAATFGGTVSSIAVSHDASLDLTASTMNRFSVRGMLSSSTIILNEPLSASGLDLGSFNVGGGVVTSTVRSIGSIGSISTLRLQDSRIYAGLVHLPPQQPLPTVPTDFANVAEIRSVSLRRSPSTSLVNSDIAAYALGNMNLGTVSMANNGIKFGVGGHSIRSVTLTDQATNKTVRAVNVASTAAFDSALTAKGVTPQDFVVVVV